MHLKSVIFSSMCSSFPAEQLDFCFLHHKGAATKRGPIVELGQKLTRGIYRRSSNFHVPNSRDYFNSLFSPTVSVYNPWCRTPSSMSKDILVLLFLQKLAETFYLENVSVAVKSLLVLSQKEKIGSVRRTEYNSTLLSVKFHSSIDSQQVPSL